MNKVQDLINKITFPDCPTDDKKNITRDLKKITLQLRDEYYKISPKRTKVYSEPFGGPITDSIGPWPEFILRGLPCQKSKKGCCTPCFYSRLPQVNLPEGQIHASLIDQVRYILDNFKYKVKENQKGPVAFPHSKFPFKPFPHALVLTPTGSFFDELEFPARIRNNILQLIQDYSINNSQPLALYIETHAEHFLNAPQLSGDFDKTIELLRLLNARVLFGFESYNLFVRNVLYNKYLNLDTFVRSAKMAKDLGLGVGAFVFVGINPLNDLEVLADAFSTLDFLHEQQISPVLMFHNIQPYTIQEMLYLYHAHRLPEPRTLLEVVAYLVNNFNDDLDDIIDSWLIADPVGGPPSPQYHIFNAKQKITCESCSRLIQKALIALRLTRNKSNFLTVYHELTKCSCYNDFLTMLEKQRQENPRLIDRTLKNIIISQSKICDYTTVRPLMNVVESFDQFYETFEKERPGTRDHNILTEIKADLLCLGLNIDPLIKDKIALHNSYIHEAGFVHAVHFFIDKQIVNTCVSESFSHQSPYCLTKRDDSFYINRDDIELARCSLLETPQWCHTKYKNYELGDIIRPHNNNVLSGMPFSNCMFFTNSTQCRFCSLGPYQKKEPVPAEVILYAVECALNINPLYELNLSGGTSATPDHTATYFSNVAKLIRKHSNIPISVELVPPENLSFINLLHDSGVNAVIMNIEIWPDNLRKIYCPGKSCISKDFYLSAISHGINLFGKGQVASVLIAGLQNQSAVIDGAKTIISLGAIPTIIPFKPFNDCELASSPTTNPKELLEINLAVSKLLFEAELSPSTQHGCTGCGGCSLENIYTL